MCFAVRDGPAHQPHDRRIHGSDCEIRKHPAGDGHAVPAFRRFGSEESRYCRRGIREEPETRYFLCDTGLLFRRCGPVLLFIAGNSTHHRRHQRAERLSDDDSNCGTDPADDGVLSGNEFLHQSENGAVVLLRDAGHRHRADLDDSHRHADFPTDFQEIRCPEQLRAGEHRRHPSGKILRPGGVRAREILPSIR